MVSRLVIDAVISWQEVPANAAPYSMTGRITRIGKRGSITLEILGTSSPLPAVRSMIGRPIIRKAHQLKRTSPAPMAPDIPKPPRGQLAALFNTAAKRPPITNKTARSVFNAVYKPA